MRTAALLSSVVWVTAYAQTILPPDQGAEMFGRSGLAPLKCEVEPLPPVLDFSFRFRAGYTVHVPFSQYHGPGHTWTVAVRIEPELVGQPIYFVDVPKLPDVFDTRTEGETGGGYLLGEGYYHASFLLVDDLDRACRSDWKIEAQLGFDDRRVKLAIAPRTVQEISVRGARPAGSRGEPLNRLTVLLHAAPVSPRMSRVQASDAVTMLGALSSLIDLAPADSVRLVVFNLEQRKEIYRSEHFTLDQLEPVRQAIFDLQLGLVDVHTLQQPVSELLSGLVNGELHAEDHSDAVVFLGPHARSTEKPAFPIDNPGAGSPRFFYLEYERPPMVNSLVARGPAGMGRRGGLVGIPDASSSGSRSGGDPEPNVVIPFPVEPRDTIDYLVGMLKGKTLIVHTPAEFASAMKQIARGK